MKGNIMNCKLLSALVIWLFYLKKPLYMNNWFIWSSKFFFWTLLKATAKEHNEHLLNACTIWLSNLLRQTSIMWMIWAICIVVFWNLPFDNGTACTAKCFALYLSAWILSSSLLYNGVRWTTKWIIQDTEHFRKDWQLYCEKFTWKLQLFLQWRHLPNIKK